MSYGYGPTCVDLIKLNTLLHRLKIAAESLVTNIRCIVCRGNTLVAFQESIEDAKLFLRTYPSSGAELNLLVNRMIKVNCELQIALTRRTELPIAASGYENNDHTVLCEGDPGNKQTFSYCSKCSKEIAVGVCTEVQSTNPVPECHDDTCNLYDIEKEFILEMKHLLGENPFEFWLGFYTDQKLQSHLSKIKQRIDSGALHPLTQLPKVRQFIVGCTNSVFRGSVLSVYNENIVTVDIDTGTLKFVNVHNSWEIGDSLLCFPPQALLCKLSSITGDVEWCKSFCNMFRKVLSKCNLVVTVKDIVPGILPMFVVDVDAHDVALDFNVNQWINKYVIPALEKVKILDLSDDAVENLFKTIDPYVIYKDESTESDSENFTESESGYIEEDIRENNSRSEIVNESIVDSFADINLEESPAKDDNELVSSTSSENMENILMNKMNFHNIINDEKLNESWNETGSNSSST